MIKNTAIILESLEMQKIQTHGVHSDKDKELKS